MLEVTEPGCGGAGQGPGALQCCPPHPAASTNGLFPLGSPSRDSHAGERSNACARWNRTRLLLWPTTASALRTQRGHCTPAWGTGSSRLMHPTPWNPPQTCPVHTPAVSRSLLSTRSVRRQSRPCAPATPRSSSLLGMGSSESHSSTSQLEAKERALRSRGALQMLQAPQVPPAHLQPPVRVRTLPSACSGLKQSETG